MRRQIIAAVAGVGLCAGSATADDGEPPARGDAGPAIFLGVLAANAGFTAYNLATLGEKKSGVYGFGETAVALPQALLFGSIALLVRDSEGDWVPAALALWTAALAGHGIYTLAADDDAPTDRAMMLSFGSRF